MNQERAKNTQSSVEAAISVGEAPPVTEAPVKQLSVSDQYILSGIVAIIVVIILVGAVLGFLMLRKRP